MSDDADNDTFCFAVEDGVLVEAPVWQSRKRGKMPGLVGGVAAAYAARAWSPQRRLDMGIAVPVGFLSLRLLRLLDIWKEAESMKGRTTMERIRKKKAEGPLAWYEAGAEAWRTRGGPAFEDCVAADHDWTGGSRPDEEIHDISVWPLADAGYGVLYRRGAFSSHEDTYAADLVSRHDSLEEAVADAKERMAEIRATVSRRSAEADDEAAAWEDRQIAEFVSHQRRLEAAHEAYRTRSVVSPDAGAPGYWTALKDAWKAVGALGESVRLGHGHRFHQDAVERVVLDPLALRIVISRPDLKAAKAVERWAEDIRPIPEAEPEEGAAWRR